jgi:lipopolysaccharide transport system ATP-binding protein
MEKVISVKNLSKQYQLGTFSTGAFITDIAKYFKRLIGKKPLIQDSNILEALSDVSFDVYDGDIIGVVGGNGAGKSTLLKLMSRITIPSRGEIILNGRISSLLEVGTGFHPELTGRENVYLNGTILGMSKSEISKKFDEIVEFSGVQRHIDTPVKRYSSGMIVRLGFSVAAFLEPEILIVDEVLAVGDSQFQEKCLAQLKRVSESGRVVIFVSHNLNSVKKLCNRGLLLTDGKLELDSDINTVIEAYVSKFSKGIVNGIIPEKLKRQYSTGEVLIKKFQIVDSNMKPTTHLYFRESPHFLFELIRKKNVTDVFLTVLIFNKEKHKVGHCDRNITKLVKESTQTNFICDMNMYLTPGSYSCTVTLYNENGGHYDYIENCYLFDVFDIPVNNKERYSGAKVAGLSYSELSVDAYETN